MSFIVALSAFAAIVVVYSTLVTVIVEALHKVFGLRSSGMNEMLRAYYDENLSGLTSQADAAGETAGVGNESHGRSATPSKPAKQFADRMTRTSPSDSLKPWYLRRWKVFRGLFSSRRKVMTTLQFIEALANTPEGAKRAKQTPEGLRASIRTAAYEFERLGEVQSEYFRSRANVLSVIAGLAVALFVNFDAIAVYKELARNQELSARLTLAVDHQMVATIAGQENLSALEMQSNFKESAENIRALGIPTGRKMFPHCEGYEFTQQVNPFDLNAGSTTYAERLAVEQYVDPRCGKARQQRVNQIWQLSYGQYIGYKNEVRSQSAPPVAANAWTWVQFRTTRVMAVFGNLQTFALWLLGTLLAGGLLGLGAPFWFKLFSRVSRIAMPAANAAIAASQLTTARQPIAVNETANEDVRPLGTSNPQILEQGYLTVLSRKRVLSEMDHESGAGVGLLSEAVPGKIFGERPSETDDV